MKVFGGIFLAAVSCTTVAGGLYPQMCMADVLGSNHQEVEMQSSNTNHETVRAKVIGKRDPLYFIKDLPLADTDKDGILSTEEIFANKTVLKNRIMIDTNNDLIITPREIAELASSVSSFRAKKSISYADKNQDNLISVDEAVALTAIGSDRFVLIDKNLDGFIDYKELYTDLLFSLFK